MKTSQHIYTFGGRQRYVVTMADTVRYTLEQAKQGATSASDLEPATDCAVLYTDDSLETVRAGKAQWVKLLDNSGVVSGATALRVLVGDSVNFLARLTVERVTDDPALSCVGEFARMNAVLAAINRDLRFCAAVA